MNDSEDSSLTLPKPPSSSTSPKKVVLTHDQINKSGETRKGENTSSFEMKQIIPSTSTPNDFLAPTTKETEFDFQTSLQPSDDITFNSNDGLSFAESFPLGSDDDDEKGDIDDSSKKNKRKQQKAKGILNNDAFDDDENSTSSDFSFGPGMDENGILAANSDTESEENMVPERLVESDLIGNKVSKTATSKNSASSTINANRPPSGNSSARNSPRTGRSGIPRLVRSRSNSLNSDASGFSSRRGSTGSVVSATDVPASGAKVDGKALNDGGQEHFIERKTFSYYSENVVRTALENLEKRSQSSFLNPEFMVWLFPSRFLDAVLNVQSPHYFESVFTSGKIL